MLCFAVFMSQTLRFDACFCCLSDSFQKLWQVKTLCVSSWKTSNASRIWICEAESKNCVIVVRTSMLRLHNAMLKLYSFAPTMQSRLLTTSSSWTWICRWTSAIWNNVSPEQYELWEDVSKTFHTHHEICITIHKHVIKYTFTHDLIRT